MEEAICNDIAATTDNVAADTVPADLHQLAPTVLSAGLQNLEATRLREEAEATRQRANQVSQAVVDASASAVLAANAVTTAAQQLVAESARLAALRTAEFAIAAEAHANLHAATQSIEQAASERQDTASASAHVFPAIVQDDAVPAATADQAFQTQVDSPDDVAWSRLNPVDIAPDTTAADPPDANVDPTDVVTAAAPAAALIPGQATHLNTIAAFVPHALAQGQQLLAACVQPFAFGLGQCGQRLSESQARARGIARREAEIEAVTVAREPRAASRAAATARPAAGPP